ncbi:hypothetical protein FKG94_13495 [Exilibacterium tricleocarpae]|uniref:Uncharacterized protein n=1 Tax=Exilibacterium tricleocarpae TaxID=2591008 RepID=A0A545TLJ0_9GAMM|nr:hypothetical protein [Exilibacterium tricleocarpae]TQV78090.1 hypothetical protein FKG94_13495 [Exilibacterium tricleocarpae]
MTLNMSHNPASSSYRVQAEAVKDRQGDQLQKQDRFGNRYNVMLKRHNSIWNKSAEKQAAHSMAAAQYPNRSPTTIQLAANNIYGAAYEAHVGRALHRDPAFSDVKDQVNIVPNRPAGQRPYTTQDLKNLNKSPGRTLRTDFMANVNGSYNNIECKGSSTAGYTQNQANMLSDIRNRGAVVTSDRGSYQRHQNLGSVQTYTVRPNTEDEMFEEEVLEPAAPPRPRPAPRPEDPYYGRRW